MVTSWGDSPSDPHTSTSGDLRYCITLANASTANVNQDGSLIQFDPGVFNVPRTIALGSSLLLKNTATPTAIAGPGASSLTVSGGGTSSNFSVFTGNYGVTATISGLTIANGYASSYGGGVYNAGTLTLTDDTLSGNSASNGGGVCNTGTMTLTSDMITDNSASNYGGGVYNAGMLTLTGDTITGNSAYWGGGGVYSNDTMTLVGDTLSSNSVNSFNGNGGGVSNNGGTMTLTDDTLSGNVADGGGGVYTAYGTMTLTGGTLSGNSATYGGGVYNVSPMTLTGGTLSGNSATYGGGVFNYGPMTLTGDTLSGNSASYGGGGVYTDDGTMRLTGDTLSGNSAVYGGGVYVDTGGATFLNNTIVVNSTSGGDIYGTVSDGSNDLIDDAASAGGLRFNGNLVGVSPLLAPLGNYGGTTQTMPLLPGSPAIDAGSTALAIDAQGHPLTTDQRGLPRVVGSSVDIGAFESSGFTLAIAAGNNQSTTINTAFTQALRLSITPMHSGDPVDGGVVTYAAPTSGASATLKPSGATTIISGTASVAATANGIPGGPYSVAATTAGATPASFSLTNTGEPPSLMVTTLNDLINPYDNLTSLREALAYAAALGGSQIVTFTPGLTGTINLTSGLTIGSNVAVAGPGAPSLTVSGGGPSSDFSVFTVDRGVTASISGLTIANGHTSGDGGGVWNEGTTTLTGDTLSGNSATNGGGVFNYGPMTLTGDTLSGNSASYGGGVFNYGPMTQTGDTLSGNSASYDGGGVYTGYGTMTLAGDTLSGNSASNAGGGIYVSTAVATVLNNTIVAHSISGGDISGTVTGSNDLIDGAASAGGLANGVNGNLVGVSPLLAPLGNYGGTTQTMPPLPGSPAIDAGSTALAVDAQGHPLTTDQRGLPRVVGSSVDIGAFESSGFTLAIAAGNNQSTTIGTAFPASLQVSVAPKHPGDPVNGGVVTFTAPAAGASATLSPSGAVAIASGSASAAATANATAGGPYAVTATSAGAAPVQFSLTNTGKAEAPSLVVTTLNDLVNPYDGVTSLREAMAYAGTLGGSQTVTFTPGLTGTINLGGGLTIGSNVAIAGPGASLLTVSGGGPSSDFSVFTVYHGVTASISGLTIANGNTSYYGSRYGGGIYSSGQLTLAGVILLGNSATYGGGVYNDGTMTLTDDTLAGNSATYGGGVCNDGTMTLTDDTLAGNSALVGGGVYNWAAGTMTLIADTLAGNSTYDYGGGVYNIGTMTLTDDTLAGNSAGNYGGGVYNTGTMALTLDTLAGNSAADGGGGVYVYNAVATVLNDTIVASSTSGGDIFGTVRGSNDLIDDAASAGGLTNGVAGNLVGVDPLLAPLGGYGGPTQTMALLPGSPAIDAGSGAATTDTDQRGVPRGHVLDIGAYQATATQLIVAGFPSSTAPGASHTFTVSATDPFGQPALDFNGPVTFSSSDPSATLPAGQSLVGGQGRFNAALNTPGAQLITASAGGLSGSQMGITVSGTPLVLTANQSIHSPNGQYELIMQGDGNLVEYGPSNEVVWDSVTYGNPGAWAVMQGDGNLVVYSAAGTALWNSVTYGNPGAYFQLQDNGNAVIDRANGTALWYGNSVVLPGRVLTANQAIYSSDGQYELIIQGDGNLVEYGPGGQVIWDSVTYGNPGAWAVMQGDGNLVVYSAAGTALWNSVTYGHPGASLVLEDGGTLEIIDRGTVIWSV